MKAALFIVAPMLLTAAAAAQAPFAVFATPSAAFLDLSADGSVALLQDAEFDFNGGWTFDARSLTRSGEAMRLYAGSSLRAIDGTGAAWGGYSQTTLRVTGPEAVHAATFPGGAVNDVSADGLRVTGTVYGTLQRAFLWDRGLGSGPTTLEPLAGHVGSEALAMSPGGGFVAGGSRPSSSGTPVPVRWSVGGRGAGVLAVPTGISGISNGYPRAVADTGVTVGESGNGTASFPHPLIWNAAGVGRMLPHAPGGAATCISADGSVVGGYVLNGGVYTATVWVNEQRFRVADLLASRGVSTAGYTLQRVGGVSADGRVIAGAASATGSPLKVFFAALPGLGCFADLGSQGGVPSPDGVMDNNDLVAFIDLFFSQAARADVGRTGGVSGPDGAWDNNDFIVFIDRFFGVCA